MIVGMVDMLSIMTIHSLTAIVVIGESWSHTSTIRLVLLWSNDERYAVLYKSPTHSDAIVPFQIIVSNNHCSLVT